MIIDDLFVPSLPNQTNDTALLAPLPVRLSAIILPIDMDPYWPSYSSRLLIACRVLTNISALRQIEIYLVTMSSDIIWHHESFKEIGISVCSFVGDSPVMQLHLLQLWSHCAHHVLVASAALTILFGGPGHQIHESPQDNRQSPFSDRLYWLFSGR